MNPHGKSRFLPFLCPFGVQLSTGTYDLKLSKSRAPHKEHSQNDIGKSIWGFLLKSGIFFRLTNIWRLWDVRYKKWENGQDARLLFAMLIVKERGYNRFNVQGLCVHFLSWKLCRSFGQCHYLPGTVEDKGRENDSKGGAWDLSWDGHYYKKENVTTTGQKKNRGKTLACVLWKLVFPSRHFS